MFPFRPQVFSNHFSHHHHHHHHYPYVPTRYSPWEYSFSYMPSSCLCNFLYVPQIYSESFDAYCFLYVIDNTLAYI